MFSRGLRAERKQAMTDQQFNSLLAHLRVLIAITGLQAGLVLFVVRQYF
jgi:hypothetical protein